MADQQTAKGGTRRRRCGNNAAASANIRHLLHGKQCRALTFVPPPAILLRVKDRTTTHTHIFMSCHFSLGVQLQRPIRSVVSPRRYSLHTNIYTCQRPARQRAHLSALTLTNNECWLHLPHTHHATGLLPFISYHVSVHFRSIAWHCNENAMKNMAVARLKHRQRPHKPTYLKVQLSLYMYGDRIQTAACHIVSCGAAEQLFVCLVGCLSRHNCHRRRRFPNNCSRSRCGIVHVSKFGATLSAVKM